MTGLPQCRAGWRWLVVVAVKTGAVLAIVIGADAAFDGVQNVGKLCKTGDDTDLDGDGGDGDTDGNPVCVLDAVPPSEANMCLSRKDLLTNESFCQIRADRLPAGWLDAGEVVADQSDVCQNARCSENEPGAEATTPETKRRRGEVAR